MIVPPDRVVPGLGLSEQAEPREKPEALHCMSLIFPALKLPDSVQVCGIVGELVRSTDLLCLFVCLCLGLRIFILWGLRID